MKHVRIPQQQSRRIKIGNELAYRQESEHLSVDITADVFIHGLSRQFWSFCQQVHEPSRQVKTEKRDQNICE